MSPQLPTVLLRAQTDERLARLAALGSERAFEAIVERYRRPLLGYARRMVGESRAEDVVQAAFVGAWAKLSEGAEVRDLRAWLFRIVHNGAINALKRASSRDVELFDDTPSLGDLHAEVERREDVRRALGGIAALPLQQREALVGVAIQGRRHRDVGSDMGVTDGAVRMLLHRARSSMRTAATALTPWPLLAWLSGERGAEVAAGGTGAGVLAGGALKAAAVLSTAAVTVSAGPQIAGHVGDAVSTREGAGTPAAALPAALPPSLHVTARRTVPADGVASTPSASKRRPVAAAPAIPVATALPNPPSTVPEPPSAGVLQQEDSTTLAQQPNRDQEFLRPAEEDEDEEISVQEEAPDTAAGERPIPADGVPDHIAEAALPEQPAAAQDAAELAAEDEAPADQAAVAPAP